jgi:acetyl esterase/lipase
MRKALLSAAFISFIGLTGFSQKVVRLFEGKAPGSEDWNYSEIEYVNPMNKGLMVRNVVDPTLEVYKPDKAVASGTSVIVCPGGGNVWLSYSSEGTDVAKWLAAKGITAFVLKYRLNHTPEDEAEFAKFTQDFFRRILTPAKEGEASKAPVPLPSEKYLGGEDGIRAVEYVREHSAEFGIDPKKVGIMGFSAGAGLTMHVIINSSPDKQPDFAAPVYGGWLGDSKIPEDAPPLFILAAADDPISNGCPDLYKAWRAAGKSAELHIYSKGGHGFGMSQRGMPVDTWIERLYDWIKASGF